MARTSRIVALVAAVVWLGAIGEAQQKSLAGATGLMPVYDSSGQDFGEAMARHMTATLFHELTLGGRDVTLLNPGGLYSPLDEPASIDFAKAAGVDVAILTTLKRVVEDRPKDDEPELVFETVVIDVRTGTRSRTLTTRQEVKRKDIERGFEGGSGYAIRRGLQISEERYTRAYYDSFSNASRELNKQPLGKAVLKMASALRPQVIEALPVGVALPLVPPGSCKVDFSVPYASRKASSKLYSMIINGREESACVLDGVVPLTVRTGKVMVEVSVRDAPFRLPVQQVYVANTLNDCASATRALALEIGSAGEALLVWK